MSTHRPRTTAPTGATIVAAVALLASLAAACSSDHRAPATIPASTTTLPPGTVTTDDWNPPHLSSGPSEANFCTALTAIYRHLGTLSHVMSVALTEQYLTDYVNYAPTVIAAAPASVQPSATTYIDAVAAYLQRLVAAGLQLTRLPAGSLAQLSSPAVNGAYRALSGYSINTCHYTIGGTING